MTSSVPRPHSLPCYGVHTTSWASVWIQGFIPAYGYDLEALTPDRVPISTSWAGTILGTTRGPRTGAMVDAVDRLNISIRSPSAVTHLEGGSEDQRRDQAREDGVGGYPEMIRQHRGRSFGFDTAVEVAAAASRSAHTERARAKRSGLAR